MAGPCLPPSGSAPTNKQKTLVSIFNRYNVCLGSWINLKKYIYILVLNQICYDIF